MNFILILLFLSLSLSKREVFTTLADLEKVLELESYLASNLENYILAEQERLEYLRRYANNFRTKHNKAEKNVQLYVANSINPYALVKKITTDWKEVEDLINTDLRTDFVRSITYIKENMRFPTDEDLNGAVAALTRFQDTYNLNTCSLGKLNAKKNISGQTAADRLELSKQSVNNDDYYNSQLWIRGTDNKLKTEVNTPREGELQKTVNDTNRRYDGSESDEPPKPQHDPSNRECYEQLCRGEISLPPEKASKLKCRFLKNKPFLMLAPFKVEEAYHKPDIFIFHDVLADSEIATIKRLAESRFQRAMIHNSDTGNGETAQYKKDKLALLKEHEHKHITDVTQRISDMTGLTMETAEELEVVHYVIGGHYELHFDFATKEAEDISKSLRTGNRIATFLFYMNDVEQGGATVFPSIEVSLWPKKGSAAFWYNLLANGDGDKMTLHAVCPVLTGSKWVSIKRIHERGQEFLRPCTNERK